MMKILYGGIVAEIAVIVFLVAGLFGAWDHSASQAAQQFGTALPQGAAVFETSLQSRISSTDTSMTLVANSVRGGSALSGYNCFTVDEGRTDAEYICGTVSGTSVTGLERGIDPLTSTTTNSTLKYAHRVGANVKITDFPLIQRLRQQANGTDTYPNLLSYAGTVCSVSSGNTSICDKAYIDGVAVAGASNANQTTKGIVEMATQTEAASSSTTGGTGAIVVYGNGMATDTPNALTRASRLLMSDMTGFLKQSWIDISANFAWTGTHTFVGATSKIGVGTTTPYLPLSVSGSGVFDATSTASAFFATSTAATSTFPALRVSGAATTTNLVISGRCVGCANGWEKITNTGTGPTTIGGIASVTATCSAGKTVIGGGGSMAQGSNGSAELEESYPSSSSAWTTSYMSYANGGAGGTMTAYAICIYP